MSRSVRTFLIMALGSLLIGTGIAFVVGGDLGADSMTTLEQGISRSLNLDMSLAPLVANALFIVALLAVDRRKVSVDTLLTPFVISLGIKAASLIVHPVSSLPLRVLYLIIGYLIIGLGIGVGAQSETGSNPYDGFVLALSEKMGRDYRVMRWILDILVLLIGILMKGSFGVGTIYAIAVTGVLGNFFIKRLKSIFGN